MTLKKYRDYIVKRLEFIESQFEDTISFENLIELCKQQDHCVKELMLIDIGAYGSIEKTE